ncbi:MAG: hypothetical protein AAGF26_19030, partial [Cyanobacteria bacterium P01_G01_bin.49]
ILVNLIGIITGTLVVFVLYAHLEINHYSVGVTKDWSKLLLRLAICGAVQGFIIAAFQLLVLPLRRLRAIKWYLINIVSMAVGLILPMTYGIITNFERGITFNDCVVTGWGLSWILTGIVGGVVAGRNKNQKILWGIVNGGVYLLWGITITFGVIFLGSTLDNSPSLLTFIVGFFLIGSTLAIGAWFNKFLYRTKNDLSLGIKHK